MKLRKLKISSFRCLEKIELDFQDYSSLIGPNNSGKSTILKAIEYFLNQTSPSMEEFREIASEKINYLGNEIEKRCFSDIVIEGEFKDIQEWERRCQGVSGIIFEDTIKLREIISATHTPETGKYSISKKYEAYIKEDVIEGLHETKIGECDEAIQKIIKELGFTGTNYKTKANISVIKEHIKTHFPQYYFQSDWEWSSSNFGIEAALKQAIPSAVVIPASTSIDDALKNTQSSAFGKLLSKVIMPKVKASAHYSDVTTSFSKLVSQLKSDESIEGLRELRKDLSERISEIINAKLILSLQEPEYDKIFGGIAELRLDDGKETPVNLQGHGLQRSLVFTLLELIAKYDSIFENEDGNQSRSVVLLYEEPELFIHPHLMRKLKAVLQNISTSSQWQVIITTHSPFLINIAENPCSLVILKKSEQHRTIVSQLKNDPFTGDERARLRAALDYHPTVCEAFFAKRSILVEGDTEVAIFSESERLVSLFKIEKSFHKDTTIVSCGGKWTISAIAKVMRNLQLDFKVIHDRDLKDLDPDNPMPNYPLHPFNANINIENSVGDKALIYQVEDTMEDILWPEERPDHRNDKPYKAWLRLKEILQDIEDNNNSLEYSALLNIVSFAYAE
ncbi:ATP-dependent endonuclease [Atlantibacter hermannii]|uniref:ATP-dependent nuclease n=2 Tax=Atlantibacter hermannii TaxID=565 RepID=UPI00289E52AD|nr:ATP-dependent endonuclease [Atlantibacter hermannii]